jgi:hypothetical protein
MPLELDRSYTLHCLKQTGQRELPDERCKKLAAGSGYLAASGFDTAPPFGAKSPIA